MKHPRTLIREAVAAQLSANLPKVDPRITPARISIHRSTPLFEAKLPAILIYTRDERIEDQPNADPGLRRRLLELSVEIIASGEAAAEEADVLAQAVEATFDADETLSLLVEGTRLTRAALAVADQGVLYGKVLGQRLRHLGRLITRDPKKSAFAAGWMNRMAEFVEGTV